MWLKTALAVIGAAFAWVYGAWDAAIMVLLAMVAIDYISGVLAAAARKELSSRVGFIGLAKKFGIFAIVAVAALIDKVVPMANGALRAAACMFFIANEGLSILENWAGLGLPLPDILKKTLVQIKDKGKATE